MSEVVVADRASKSLAIPHLGITYRVMLAAAANANKAGLDFIREWKVMYRGVPIGNVKLKNFTY